MKHGHGAFTKTLARAILPPVVAQALRHLVQSRSADTIRFSGNYANWESAQSHSTGYEADVILRTTCSALLKVKRGEALYERDSVIFDQPVLPFPLLAGLFRAALEHDLCLSVADFGGSLGSSYFQCRAVLSPVTRLEWSVIEQPAFVECGRRHFQDTTLRFYRTPDECALFRDSHVLLLSSVVVPAIAP
jgi:putative methyltransferase (TIGR04325 family)